MRKKLFQMRSTYTFLNTLIYNKKLHHVKYYYKKRNLFTNISIFFELIVADHGICNHDLMKEIKIIE